MLSRNLSLEILIVMIRTTYNELPDEIVLNERCRNAGSKEVLPMVFCPFLQNHLETKFQSRNL